MAINVQEAHEMPVVIYTQRRTLREKRFGAMTRRQAGEPTL
jgi:hypothetical protein